MAVTGSIGYAGSVISFENPVSINCTMPEGQYPNGQISFDNIMDGAAYWKNNDQSNPRSITLCLCDSAGNNRVALFTISLLKNGSNTTIKTANISGATGLTGKALYLVAEGEGANVIQLRRATNITVNTAYGYRSISSTGMAHGSFSVSNMTPLVGETVTVTVTPWAGYTAGTPYTSPAVTMTSAGTNTWTFVMPNSDITLTFPESKINYTVSKNVSPSGGGTLSLNKTTANVDDEITITATPATGYYLKSLSTNPSRTIKNNKFTMPASNVTVTAVFEKITYSITPQVEPSGAGSITLNRQTATYGDTVTVSQTPAAGYYFNGWETNPANLISNGQFSMPNQNVTVKAKYLLRSTANVDKSSVTDGDVVKLTIIPDKQSYSHRYKLSFGTNMETAWTTVNQGTTVVNLPALPSGNNSWAKQIPNAKTKAGTLKVETYNGSTKIGEYTINMTYNVPSTALPTLGTISTSVARSIGGTNYANVGDHYVQGHCGVTIGVRGNGVLDSKITKLELWMNSGYNGSSYSKTTTYGGSNSYEDISFTTGLLTIAGIITITARVTDSRGNQATTTTTINVEAYSPPTGTLTVKRVDSAGADDVLGQYAKYTQTNGYTHIGNNGISGKLVALSEEENIDLSNGSGFVFPNTHKTFDRLTEYQIQLVLWDSFETTTITAKLPTAQFMLFFGADGTRMALMKAVNSGLSKNGKNGVIELSSDAQVYVGTETLEEYIKKQTVYVDGGNRATFEIPAPSASQLARFWIALMWVFPSAEGTNPGLYAIIRNMTNEVYVKSLISNTPVTFTGTYANGKITITANSTLWGGIRVMTFN